MPVLLECQYILSKLISNIDDICFGEVLADNVRTDDITCLQVSIVIRPFCNVGFSRLGRSCILSSKEDAS